MARCVAALRACGGSADAACTRLLSGDAGPVAAGAGEGEISAARGDGGVAAGDAIPPGKEERQEAVTAARLTEVTGQPFARCLAALRTAQQQRGGGSSAAAVDEAAAALLGLPAPEGVGAAAAVPVEEEEEEDEAAEAVRPAKRLRTTSGDDAGQAEG